MKKIDWFFALAIGAVTAFVYWCCLANYVYPGQSASLIVAWKGLDVSSLGEYPVMKSFASLFGVSNLFSVFCSAISMMCAYIIVALIIRGRIEKSDIEKKSIFISRAAGIVTVTVLAFTPAMMSGSTHLSAESFNLMLLLVLFALSIAYYRTSTRFLAHILPLLMGVLSAFALANTLALLPGIIVLAVVLGFCSVKRGENPGLKLFFFLFALHVTYFTYLPIVSESFISTLKTSSSQLVSLFTRQGALLSGLFVVAPFCFAYIASGRAFSKSPGFSSWVFHFTLLIFSILNVATSLSPSSLLQQSGFLPLITSFLAAATTAYVTVFFLAQFILQQNSLRNISLVSIGLFSFVVVASLIINIFSFGNSRGDFADKIAEMIIKDMRGRKWIVTDGTLDNHIRIAAAKAGKEVYLVCLHRDDDEQYMQSLRKLVRETDLCGPKNAELLLSLQLGVLPFVQDWFAADPNVASEVVVYGAPDLWYRSGFKPVPEFLFFGADREIEVNWAEQWSKVDSLLSVPKGWGSNKLWKEKDVLKRHRMTIRRHIGMVANNRGVYLQDEKRPDEAWKMYCLVRESIDSDNISALFNQFEMARLGYSEAQKHEHEIEKTFKSIISDKDRRYVLWQLANYYGYIRSPEIFVKLGFTWARTGRPGEALAQIRRAIDFIPTDKRYSLMNMMASLYANESDVKKSRSLYEAVLEKNKNDHDALMGLMRLELIEGNADKAVEYLERAAKVGEGSRAKTELAMASLIRSDFQNAKKLLREVVDSNPKDMVSWSLYAAVVIQQYDNAKPAEKKEFMKELQERIVPEMERNSSDKFNYHLQTTKAFVMLRKGDENRRAARDAFVAASKLRPDVIATRDIVMGLDISLNDTVEAERHAKETLRKDRKSPLANYIMGALSLQKGDFASAEAFLRRSANAPRPLAIALNDLAEVLRRQNRILEAEQFARQAVKAAPGMYIVYETLASILLESKSRNLNEIEGYILKAIELSVNSLQKEDLRVLMTLARVQILKGDLLRAKGTIRKIGSRKEELSDFEQKEFEELRKSAR